MNCILKSYIVKVTLFLYYALELCSLHESVKGGYHMNKKHWNTVTIGGDVDDTLLKELIDHSYELIYAKLPKREKELVG
ncbi:MmcQ/YjbR family DNA-binding protein [bacterium]|nr:MmcQ/YjbR family DNA-binding protein [bacterium]MBU1883299.1 MmcQ/YjbR family DNA-binding protein [bacterium]